MQHVLPGNPTIVAVASPPGRSPRGLLRVSGPGTDTVLAALLDDAPKAVRSLVAVRLRTPVLPALALRFAGPNSYTGEDAAELQVPGNAALLDRLLHRAIEACPGARLAEPGEFTFRAYTAGKLDLTQAEGIAATIHAASDSQLRAATLLREGKLGTAANQLVDRLGGLLALVEAGIDFTDQEDVVPIAPADLHDRLNAVGDELDGVLRNSRPWGAVEALPRVVLVGMPSVGKSTLFNALLGKERAVIDPMPGTTRDVLEEPLRLRDPAGREAEVMLVDLAGLDTPASRLDRAARAAASDALRRADLVLAVRECAAASSKVPMLKDAPIVHVATKADCQTPSPYNLKPHVVRISAATGQGLDTLREQIVQRLRASPVSISADMLALQPRHESGLKAAAAHLGTATALLAAHPSPHTLPDIELLADSMRAALDALAGLGGRLTPDEVIGRVFSTFCVGK